MPTLEQRFHERITANALADTLAHFSPRRTISPQSLLEMNIAPSVVNEMMSGASFATMAKVDLPRIAVDYRTQDGQPRTESTNIIDFEVVGLLGEGGMGRVLLARQHTLAREVAIKTSKEGDFSESATHALLQEGRIMGALEHPGIVPVHALGLDASGNPLLVMKRIEGVSLRVLLDDASHAGWKSISANAADRIEAIIEILMRVCQTLAFAHSRGIVHRDIKPENIMIGAYGETYLCDWGIATHIDDAAASAGALVGTPAYMAPEMLLGGAIDARTDVYLLGATLHEVLTRRLRHEGASMHEILHSVAVSAPWSYDATIAPELARLCNRSTSSDPEQRPASADVFRRELVEYLHQRGAMLLCEAALERLQALEALLAAAHADSVPADLAAAYRHATEARFGFGQSLRIHPNLDAAKQGRDRALIALFDLELRQRHVETAAALLDELTDPTPELVDRLSAARKEADARRLEAAGLRAIARDLDPTIAVRSRVIVLGAMIFCSTLVAAWIFLKTKPSQITPADTVLFASILVVMGAVVLVILRRRIGETLFNRRMIAFFYTTAIFLFVHRFIAWHCDQTVRQILMGDTVMFIALTTVGALIFERRIALGAFVCTSSLIAMMIYPGAIIGIFQLMTVGLLLASVWIWRASSERAGAELT